MNTVHAHIPYINLIKRNVEMGWKEGRLQGNVISLMSPTLVKYNFYERKVQS